MVLAQDLRNAVLQAAFNGLLTKHIETDSSAFNLIKQMNEEKRTNKSKYYPINEEYKKNIPDSWAITKIGNIIIKDLGGGTPSKNNPRYWNGNIPWMSVKDFSNSKNNILNDTIDHISQEGVDNSATNIIDTDAIILCTRMGLGKFCKVTQPTAINQDLRAIWISKQINEDYFIHFYSSLTIVGTGTTVKGIKKDELFNHLIPIPPIEEQQRIVDRINELMEKIDDYEKVEKELVELENKFPIDMKNALLQAAMQGKLTKQLDSDSSVDEMLEAIKEEKKQLIKDKKIKKEKALPSIEENDIPFEIPENWRWEKIGNIIDCGAGATPPRSKMEYYKDGTIPWLKTGELTDGYIVKSEENVTEQAFKDYSLRLNKKNDILIAMYGATIGKLGIVTKPLTTNQACCGCTPFIGIYYKYLFYYFMSIKSTLIKKAEGGAQPNISRDKIRNYLIPIPPTEEQKRMVEKLEQLLPLCDTL